MSFMSVATAIGFTGIGATIASGVMMGGTFGMIGNVVAGRDPFDNIGQSLLLGGIGSGIMGALGGGAGAAGAEAAGGSGFTSMGSAAANTAAALNMPTAATAPVIGSGLDFATSITPPPSALQTDYSMFSGIGGGTGGPLGSAIQGAYTPMSSAGLDLSPGSGPGSSVSLTPAPNYNSVGYSRATPITPQEQLGWRAGVDYNIGAPSSVPPVAPVSTPSVVDSMTNYGIGTSTTAAPSAVDSMANYNIGTPPSAAATPTTKAAVDPSKVKFTDNPITWMKEHPLQTAAIGAMGMGALSPQKPLQFAQPTQTTAPYNPSGPVRRPYDPERNLFTDYGILQPVRAAKGGDLDMKDGGFVVPADVVSHLGNGDTDAGLGALAQRTGARPIKGRGDGMSDSIPASIEGRQPARVAAGEAYIDRDQVQRLGGGNQKRGAQKLYSMMDKVRRARTGTPKQGRQIDAGRFIPT